MGSATVREMTVGEGEVAVGEGDADVAGVVGVGVVRRCCRVGVGVGVGEAVVPQPASPDKITSISASDKPKIESRLKKDFDDISTPLFFPPEALFY